MDAAALQAFDRERYLNLATFRKSGVAVETPVWFALHDAELWCFSEGDAGKVKRLRNNGRIRVAACSVRGRVTGDWLEGQGRIVSDAHQIAAGYAALRAKYGLQMRLADALSKLTGRFDRRAVLAFALD